jgi:hypothetical protein
MNFIDLIIEISNNPLVIAILPSILTGIVTYLITKKSTKNDKKIEIYQNSFDLVYLPLYRKFKNIPHYDILSVKEYKVIYLQLHTFYEKHIIYTNPTLSVLLYEYKKKIENDKNPYDVLSRIHTHINNNYNKLRSKLHYPCMSNIDLFRYKSIYFKLASINMLLVIIIFIIIMFMGLFNYYKLDINLINILAVIAALLILAVIITLTLLITYYVAEVIYNKFIKKKHKVKSCL